MNIESKLVIVCTTFHVYISILEDNILKRKKTDIIN